MQRGVERILFLGTVVLAALCGAAPAYAELAWRATPEIAADEGHGGHGGGHRHDGPRRYYLRDGAGAELSVALPDMKAKSLAVQDEAVVFPPTGKEGYHRLLARRAAGAGEEVALRYVYAPGKPTGYSPADLLALPSTRLELVPQPLPREHWRYESGGPAAFVVRFDGRPLAELPVRMITSNGSLVEATTDALGVVSFELPEDFERVRPGRANNRAAEFVVTAEHLATDARFTTTLNADYSVNPAHWESTALGLGMLTAGFFVGLVLVRPREEKQA